MYKKKGVEQLNPLLKNNFVINSYAPLTGDRYLFSYFRAAWIYDDDIVAIGKVACVYCKVIAIWQH